MSAHEKCIGTFDGLNPTSADNRRAKKVASKREENYHEDFECTAKRIRNRSLLE